MIELLTRLEVQLDAEPSRGQAAFFSLIDLTKAEDCTKAEAKRMIDAWTVRRGYRWHMNAVEYVSVIRDAIDTKRSTRAK